MPAPVSVTVITRFPVLADDAALSPETLGGGSVRMILSVGDPDALFARAPVRRSETAST